MAFRAALALAIDRDAPERLRGQASLSVPRTFLDQVDFAALVQAGSVVIDAARVEAAETVLDGLLESELRLTFQ